MNLAFSAVLIVILLLPGAFFLRIYQGSAADLPRADSNFTQNLAAYILLSLPVHMLGLSIVQLLPLKIHLEVLFSVLVGWFPEDESLDLYTAQLVGPFYLGLWYVIFAALLGLLLGWTVRYVVRLFYLDLLFPLIRPQSNWFYFFSGEILSIEAAERYPRFSYRDKWRAITTSQRFLEDMDVSVAVLVPIEGQIFLYYGYLYDYQQRNNELERIILTDVIRRPIASDEGVVDDESETRFYSVKGDYLAFEVSDIRTLNFQYIFTADPEDDSDDA